MNTLRSAAAIRRGPFRVVSVAMVLASAFAVGALYVANQPSQNLPLIRSVAAPASNPTAEPSGAALPAGALPAAAVSYICGSSTLSSAAAPAVAFISGVRTGSHSGYDRLAIQFSGPRPAGIELRPQSGTTFTRSSRGDTVTLAGTSGIQVIIRGADAHTAYIGPTDFTASGPALREVRQVEDFEGQVQLGLGLSGTPCYRAYILANPTRLVIDIQSS